MNFFDTTNATLTDLPISPRSEKSQARALHRLTGGDRRFGIRYPDRRYDNCQKEEPVSPVGPNIFGGGTSWGPGRGRKEWPYGRRSMRSWTGGTWPDIALAEVPRDEPRVVEGHSDEELGTG